jgi:PEP-CTERM motif-containing protein
MNVMSVKRFSLIVALVLAIPSAGWAGACANATEATYDTAGFSCSLGPLLFSNFSYASSASGGGIAPPDSGINVLPVTLGGESGFQFSGAFLAGPNQTSDGVIGYTVTCVGCSLTDWQLKIVAGATGTGSASVVEVASNGQSLFTFTGGGINILSDGGPFIPSSTATVVTKDIGASGGTDGAGHVSVVDNLWSTSAVPEPGTLALLGTGLVGVTTLLRRKIKL